MAYVCFTQNKLKFWIQGISLIRFFGPPRAREELMFVKSRRFAFFGPPRAHEELMFVKSRRFAFFGPPSACGAFNVCKIKTSVFQANTVVYFILLVKIFACLHKCSNVVI